MLDFKPFQTVKISTVISYKYLKSLFFYSYFPIPPQQTHEAAELQRRDCDISRSTYQKYESGNLNIPIRVIITLKEIYGCTYDDFFKDLIK